MSKYLDIEERRKEFENIRKADIVAHELRNVDEQYTFYYDETNNIRRLRIRDGKFNVTQLNDFILGGIVLKNKNEELDLAELRFALKLQKNVAEIKLKHVATGSFVDLIRSERMTVFLQWLHDNRLTIHYHHLDPFYWSIVDIIDSILAGYGDSSLFTHQQILKCDLYEILKSDKPAVLALFDKYSYPSLTVENRYQFVKDMIELVDARSSIIPHFNFYMLKGVLQIGLKIESLNFIENNEPKVLIDSFSDFYKGRVRLFDKAMHIFDDEPVISAHIAEDELFVDLYKGRYRFSISHEEEGIQISDMVVGIMGKMHTYLRETSSANIEVDCANMDEISKKNLELLGQLLSSSNQESNAFFHHVASAYDLLKERILFSPKP